MPHLAVMITVEWTISVPDAAVSEILVAQLSEYGFEGFEEASQILRAFGPEHGIDKPGALQLLQGYGLEWTEAAIPEQNWNAVWEAQFEPVVVGDFCTVRARFHLPATGTAHEVIITPKMSFGTGHHATTQLMIEAMQELPLKGASVLDFGTGTGVLAILAEKLRASRVLGIDNDSWSVENAAENSADNGCRRLELRSGSLEAVGAESFNVILANINRHILVRYFPDFGRHLLADGILLMSGLLREDEPLLIATAQENGWEKTGSKHRGDWLCLRFRREK